MSPLAVLRALALGALLCGAAFAEVPATTPTTDSFYASLMRDGELLADQGKSAAAVKSLRIACFGMLDQPVVLAHCLVRLGLAQAASGDGGGFRATFSRLLELESRAPSYASADIAPPIRSAFEQQVAQRIPSTVLVASPTFQRLATDEGKESKRGRKESSARAKTPPEPAGDAKRAPQANPVPPPAPTPHAEPAPASTAPVPPPTPTPATVQQPAGEKPASAAPPEAPKSAPTERPAPAQAPAPQPVPPSAAPAPAGPAAATPGVLSAEERAALTTARTRMQEARVAADLVAAADTATKIADAHPTSVEANALAGEIFYRSSRWPAAVIYLRRSGPPAGQPLLAFYLAVSQFESGDRAGAEATLRPLLGKLQHTPYVQSYIQKILPP